MPEFSLCLQCSYKSQSTMLRSQVFLSGQSEWEQSLRQFWFPVIILYTGAVLVAATTLTVGVGLIRSR